MWTYESSATGVGPEATTFFTNDDPGRWVTVEAANLPAKLSGTHKTGPVQTLRGRPVGVQKSDHRYIGRPETIESVFYMWRTTGDRKWQDMGWTMFVAWCESALNVAG